MKTEQQSNSGAELTDEQRAYADGLMRELGAEQAVEYLRRRADLMKDVQEKRANPDAWPRGDYYLTFCDPSKPDGQQFLGACVIDDAVNWFDAVQQSDRRGCNPGGEVTVSERIGVHANFPRNRLLTFAEIQAFGMVTP